MQAGICRDSSAPQTPLGMTDLTLVLENIENNGRSSLSYRLTHPAAMLVALAAATAVISRNYYYFLAGPRPLWNALVHDRNSHYEFAVRLALALRGFHPVEFLSIMLGQSKVWPPVHGLLTALLMAPGGPDYRLAVIPSLLGWWMTAAFAFLTAKRINPAGGDAAGLIAAALVLASPAYRDYGADIMLESLGAGLTIMALYMYVVAVQDASARAWRNLAIVLTILFFEKYNYWMLAAMALGGAEILRDPRGWLKTARAIMGRINHHVLIREMSYPLNLIAIAMLVLMAAVWIRGPHPLNLGPYSIAVYPPRDLLTKRRRMPPWRSVSGAAPRQAGGEGYSPLPGSNRRGANWSSGMCSRSPLRS